MPVLDCRSTKAGERCVMKTATLWERIWWWGEERWFHFRQRKEDRHRQRLVHAHYGRALAMYREHKGRYSMAYCLEAMKEKR